MREIEKLANEQFNGDIPAAIEYVYRNHAQNKNSYMDKIYSEFTKEELRMAAEILVKMTKERCGENVVHNIFKAEKLISRLDMTIEEILGADKNPFKKKCILALCCLVLTVIVPVLVIKFFNITDAENQKILYQWQSIIIGIIAIDLGPCIIKFFQFKKAKKLLESLEKVLKSK